MSDWEPSADGDERAGLNDRSNYQRCFVCGAQNATGLQVEFRREGEQVVADFLPEEAFQGFPGVVHGGILASLLDEALSRTALLHGEWVMTGRLEIRYRQPAVVGQMLRVTAEIEQRRARMVIARGLIALAADPKVVIAEARGTFLPYPEKLRQQALQAYPGLERWF
ncbi:MAG TPA: PaaI family thioesterase [Ktedonobacterales bacterium]|nr:PaaI family thioesterase [Ktedonobacterales bacterium]